MTHLLTWIIVVVILALFALMILATMADLLEPLRRRWWRYRHWTPEERAWLARTRNVAGVTEGEPTESFKTLPTV